MTERNQIRGGYTVLHSSPMTSAERDGRMQLEARALLPQYDGKY
jgi:hypothetical protein